jgi:hypothetical protein
VIFGWTHVSFFLATTLLFALPIPPYDYLLLFLSVCLHANFSFFRIASVLFLTLILSRRNQYILTSCMSPLAPHTHSLIHSSASGIILLE